MLGGDFGLDARLDVVDFFVIVGGGDITGEVAAGVAEDARKGGAVAAELGRFDAGLVGVDGFFDGVYAE